VYVTLHHTGRERVEETLCHVMGASLEPLTSDPLGQRVHGHLNVNCGPLLNGGTGNKFSSVRITSKWSGVIYERRLSEITSQCLLWLLKANQLVLYHSILSRL
jgi:hypothetical protein